MVGGARPEKGVRGEDDEELGQPIRGRSTLNRAVITSLLGKKRRVANPEGGEGGAWDIGRLSDTVHGRT